MTLNFILKGFIIKQLIPFECKNIFYIRKNVCEVENKRKLLKSNHKLETLRFKKIFK